MVSPIEYKAPIAYITMIAGLYMGLARRRWLVGLISAWGG